MNISTTRQLLASMLAGGSRPASSGPRPLTKYSGLADIRGVEDLGVALAERVAARLHDQSPDRVLIWEEIEDIPLAHVVARELDCQVVRVVNADGILDFDGDLSAGHRVVIVSDAFRSKRTVDALERLVDHAGANVVALAALVGDTSPEPTDGVERPTVALIRPEDLESGSSPHQAVR